MFSGSSVAIPIPIASLWFQTPSGSSYTRGSMRPISIIPLAAFLPLALAAQDRTSVTGTATYLERIALPKNAVFEAVLLDVSQAGAPAQPIGQMQLEGPGQPPFYFSMPYD